jgi:hypothetical protein
MSLTPFPVLLFNKAPVTTNFLHFSMILDTQFANGTHS